MTWWLRWAAAFLAAVLAVGVGLFGAGSASALTASAAETRVGALTSAAAVVVGSSAGITAGQRLGNDLPRPAIVVATGVAAEAGVAMARPSTFVRTEALSGRGSARTVQELTDSMRTNGWQGDPIKVVELNGERIVVDGHHRLAAAQRAGIDVPYEVVGPSTVIGPGQWSSVDDILRDAASVGPNRIR